MAFLKLHSTKLIVLSPAGVRGLRSRRQALLQRTLGDSPRPIHSSFCERLFSQSQRRRPTGLAKAAAVGQYGPLEYWVMGTDEEVGQALIRSFCDRRAS